MSERKLSEIIYKWRVRIGLISTILSFILAKPTFYTLVAGALIAMLGLAIRIWACGNLRKEKALTTSGPYRYTRNPLYFGSMILGVSTVVACRSWIVLGIFLVNFLIIYPVVIHTEKERMSALFPEKYREYSEHVPLFFPAIRPKLPRDPESHFSWELYKQNKENRAVMGSVIFYIFLILKMIFI
ncbi:MAG: isoprenylcysteine carboxylmethyltransferase family protein [Candidatus Aminicenantes bacterium]|jgi:protein-S-isoprenylcysteine O-methyltransferase Ste14